jgi:RHS repeat-associated protein
MTLEVLGSYPYPANIYAYDPWGKRVMSGYNPNYSSPQPNYTYTFYGVTGQALARVTCNGSNYPAYPTCAIVGQNVYFGQKLITAGGVNVVTDRLGSVRANGQGESSAYYPYGEERTSTVDGREKFGTYFRDAIGQDYADQRYYGSGTGSFFTPDPGGIKTANPGDPTSWNRYAYVQGDPINSGDPAGLGGDSGPGTSGSAPPGGCSVDEYGSINCPGDNGGGAPSGGGPSGGGGSSSRQGNYLNGPATPKQEKQFQKAFKYAEKELKKPDCAGLFGGSGAATMDATTYTLAALFNSDGTLNSDALAADQWVNGQPTKNVTINMIGSFFSPSSSSLGQSLLGAGLSVTQVEAFVLLHELGHETGVLGNDNPGSGGESAAAQFNVQILNDCFGVNAQVKR